MPTPLKGKLPAVQLRGHLVACARASECVYAYVCVHAFRLGVTFGRMGLSAYIYCVVWVIHMPAKKCRRSVYRAQIWASVIVVGSKDWGHLKHQNLMLRKALPISSKEWTEVSKMFSSVFHSVRLIFQQFTTPPLSKNKDEPFLIKVHWIKKQKKTSQRYYLPAIMGIGKQPESALQMSRPWPWSRRKAF